MKRITSALKGHLGRAAALAFLSAACALLLAASTSAHPRRSERRHRPPPGAAKFYVGAAKADVTPPNLADFYLGGYGIGPVHLAQAVLRHIYFRVIAIRDHKGNQVVIGALDSQGYSVAYQQGPYGFRVIEDDIRAKLGIPVSHIVLQATHTHNGPDEIGVWGGVPDTYFAFVKAQIEAAVTQAVRRERPALLHVGTADMKGFQATFAANPGTTDTGDLAQYPVDQQLRVLQAVTPRRRRVIATLVNFSTHPTVYGPLNKVSPDWPGATATYLEGDQLDVPAARHYGYPGSVAIVTVGAVGHTWPASVPNGAEPSVAPASATDDNYPADHYGDAVAALAMRSVAKRRGFWLGQSRVGGTEQMVHVENTNPILAVAGAEPGNATPLGGYKIDRADTPPWAYGDVYVAPVTALRLGGLPLFAVPGEPYPSIKFSLNKDVHVPVSFIFGLAQDQLGYAEELSDYNGALQCSTTDEWFFTISPVFGSDVDRLQRENAGALGFRVTGSALPAYGPGKIPPSTNCTEQEIEGQGSTSVPVG